MEIQITKREKCLCTCCMEEYEVKTVLVREQTVFRNVKVDYNFIQVCGEVADIVGGKGSS